MLECVFWLEIIINGVDSEYFSLDIEFSNFFFEDVILIVFMGIMDYWINVEGIIWFVCEVMF